MNTNIKEFKIKKIKRRADYSSLIVDIGDFEIVMSDFDCYEHIADVERFIRENIDYTFSIEEFEDLFRKRLCSRGEKITLGYVIKINKKETN